MEINSFSDQFPCLTRSDASGKIGYISTITVFIFFKDDYVVFTFHHQNCRQVSAYWNLRLSIDRMNPAELWKPCQDWIRSQNVNTTYIFHVWLLTALASQNRCYVLLSKFTSGLTSVPLTLTAKPVLPPNPRPPGKL